MPKTLFRLNVHVHVRYNDGADKASQYFPEHVGFYETLDEVRLAATAEALALAQRIVFANRENRELYHFDHAEFDVARLDDVSATYRDEHRAAASALLEAALKRL